jgi:hypothetical protein
MPKKGNSKRGAANPKMNKFPRISNYLEARHPKVYELIENLAMQGSLSPRRGGGITFLLPDTALVNKINKLIESDSPEDATDIVSSLIITEYLPTVKEFAAMKDDIPTLLGKKLVVKAVGSSKVDLDGGAALTPDTGFKPFGRVGNAQRGNMAVWELKGEVEYKNAPKAQGGSSHKKRGGAVGGSVGGYSGGDSSREDIDNFVQEVVQAEYRNIRDCPIGEKRKSPMLRAVVNQLRAWKGTENYEKARAVLSLHPIISFFLIFKNRLYFPWNTLSRQELSGNEDAVDELKRMMEEGGDGYILSDPRGAKNALNALKASNPVKITMPDTIRKIYAEIDSSNQVTGGMGVAGNLYPAAAHNAFRANPGLHLLIDEFRHFLYASIKEMNCRHTAYDEARAFNDLVRQVNCFRSLTQPSGTSMDKPDLLEKAKDVLQVKAPFWNGFALFVPCVNFDSQGGYAYTGGDDDDDSKDPDAELGEDLEKINEPADDKYEEKLGKDVLTWLNNNDGELPGVAGKVYVCMKQD